MPICWCPLDVRASRESYENERDTRYRAAKMNRRKSSPRQDPLEADIQRVMAASAAESMAEEELHRSVGGTDSVVVIENSNLQRHEV